MRHLGLFEGIGGFSLAVKWMGWETVAWCEIDPFCQKVLSYHFPNADRHNDIKTTDFIKYANTIDILTGGFPCQPYSTAGKRKGKEDNRHLWPEMLRAIRQVQPRYVVGENVRGLTNWNGGMVFDEVQSDLETQGYEVLPFLLPACGVDAPHRRDRIWFIANTTSIGRIQSDSRTITSKYNKLCSGNVPNTNGQGLPERNERRKFETSEKSFQGRESSREYTAQNWKEFPTQSPVCGGNDGLPRELDGITFPRWRRESIKAYGNAVVPQVVYQIFKAIEEYEQRFK